MTDEQRIKLFSELLSLYLAAVKVNRKFEQIIKKYPGLKSYDSFTVLAEDADRLSIDLLEWHDRVRAVTDQDFMKE